MLHEDYASSRDFSLIEEFLRFLDGPEQRDVMAATFWRALEAADWQLAEGCVAAGYPIQPVDPCDSGPLHDTINRYPLRTDILDWLVQRGADIDRRGQGNITPLIAAIHRGSEPLVRRLLESGADPNASTIVDDDITPLMAAAQGGHRGIAALLLAHGADVRRRSRWQTDAVGIATANGHADVAQLIRTHEPDG